MNIPKTNNVDWLVHLTFINLSCLQLAWTNATIVRVGLDVDIAKANIKSLWRQTARKAVKCAAERKRRKKSKGVKCYGPINKINYKKKFPACLVVCA